MALASVIATKKAVLTTPHVTAYNQLTSSAQTAVTIKAALGDPDTNTTQRKLSLLVDEGLAVQVRSPNNPNGSTPVGDSAQYTLS